MQERFKGGVAAVWGGNRYRANAMRGETEEKRGEAARPFAGCFEGGDCAPSALRLCGRKDRKVEKPGVPARGRAHPLFSIGW